MYWTLLQQSIVDKFECFEYYVISYIEIVPKISIQGFTLSCLIIQVECEFKWLKHELYTWGIWNLVEIGDMLNMHMDWLVLWF